MVPHELRKLWLLNGAHSLMAYGATIRRHETVADAIADPIVRGWVDEWWDVAQRQLPLDDAVVTAYRAALLDRFGNPRMRDQLSRIAADGSQKLPIRIVLTLRGQRGDDPDGQLLRSVGGNRAESMAHPRVARTVEQRCPVRVTTASPVAAAASDVPPLVHHADDRVADRVRDCSCLRRRA